MTDIESFRQTVWDYYHRHGRELPWRQPVLDPYTIMVSEIMLQQTQVIRVIPKYEQFLKTFPTIESLAAASFADVLAVWNGLGYNRRAKFLREAAQAVVASYQGVMPRTQSELVTLPGIGVNTAAAIMAYAYNQPVVFVETNIRTVFIYHFFNNEEGVSDKQLLPYIEAALDEEHPREWYWALMDYGTHLKATVGNRSQSSRHYKKQSAFHGSKRQLRAQVLRALLVGGQTADKLGQLFVDERLGQVMHELEKEQLITKENNHFTLT